MHNVEYKVGLLCGRFKGLPRTQALEFSVLNQTLFNNVLRRLVFIQVRVVAVVMFFFSVHL